MQIKYLKFFILILSFSTNLFSAAENKTPNLLSMPQEVTLELIQENLDIFDIIALSRTCTDLKITTQLFFDLPNIKTIQDLIKNLYFQYKQELNSLEKCEKNGPTYYLINNKLKSIIFTVSEDAIKTHDKQKLELLLKYYKATNTKNYNNKKTLLHVASQHGTPEIINILFSTGAKANTLDIYEYSPIDYAFESESFLLSAHLMHTLLSEIAKHEPSTDISLLINSSSCTGTLKKAREELVTNKNLLNNKKEFEEAFYKAHKCRIRSPATSMN